MRKRYFNEFATLSTKHKVQANNEQVLKKHESSQRTMKDISPALREIKEVRLATDGGSLKF